MTQQTEDTTAPVVLPNRTLEVDAPFVVPNQAIVAFLQAKLNEARTSNDMLNVALQHAMTENLALKQENQSLKKQETEGKEQ
jgi:hypothetical protein